MIQLHTRTFTRAKLACSPCKGGVSLQIAHRGYRLRLAPQPSRFDALPQAWEALASPSRDDLESLAFCVLFAYPIIAYLAAHAVWALQLEGRI